MIIRRAVVATTFALLTAVAASAAAARADQVYAVEGRDVFRLGNGDSQSKTIYHGVQRLSVSRSANGTTTYIARVEYDKDGDGGRQHQRASFTSTLLPSGQQKDGPSSDPDYLTVLNQPFAVQLDAATMRDLRHVKRPVPFDFPSPMTAATLGTPTPRQTSIEWAIASAWPRSSAARPGKAPGVSTSEMMGRSKRSASCMSRAALR